MPIWILLYVTAAVADVLVWSGLAAPFVSGAEAHWGAGARWGWYGVLAAVLLLLPVAFGRATAQTRKQRGRPPNAGGATLQSGAIVALLLLAAGGWAAGAVPVAPAKIGLAFLQGRPVPRLEPAQPQPEPASTSAAPAEAAHPGTAGSNQVEAAAAAVPVRADVAPDVLEAFLTARRGDFALSRGLELDRRAYAEALTVSGAAHRMSDLGSNAIIGGFLVSAFSEKAGSTVAQARGDMYVKYQIGDAEFMNADRLVQKLGPRCRELLVDYLEARERRLSELAKIERLRPTPEETSAIDGLLLDGAHFERVAPDRVAVSFAWSDDLRTPTELVREGGRWRVDKAGFPDDRITLVSKPKPELHAAADVPAADRADIEYAAGLLHVRVLPYMSIPPDYCPAVADSLTERSASLIAMQIGRKELLLHQIPGQPRPGPVDRDALSRMIGIARRFGLSGEGEALWGISAWRRLPRRGREFFAEMCRAEIDINVYRHRELAPKELVERFAHELEHGAVLERIDAGRYRAQFSQNDHLFFANFTDVHAVKQEGRWRIDLDPLWKNL